MASSTIKPAWAVRVNAKIVRTAPRDADAGKVAAMFGLCGSYCETLYDNLKLDIRPGRIIAVIGPSGAGKSVLLGEVMRQIPDAVKLPLASVARSERPAVTFLRGGTLSERLRILSRCGLAEAAALTTPARQLSGGQTYRLALAAALHQAGRKNRPALVVADEFAATLDSTTATVLCRQIRKRIRDSSIAMLIATPRGELLGALEPDAVLVKPIAEPPHWLGRVEPSAPWRGRIVRGSIADYDALSAFHYLAGRPAAHKRVYAIRSPKEIRRLGGPNVAAVVVVSPPLANVRGRNLATNRRYTGPDRSAAMALLNAEVECISRVVVHPIYRGCGLAVRLTAHALAKAQTPLTEALAAMGAVHPFFEQAGMTAYKLGPDQHVARLVSAAEAVGLSPADLAAVEPVRNLLARKQSRRARFLHEELQRCLARIFSPAQQSRLADPIEETCRRTARQYVYYLAERSVR